MKKINLFALIFLFVGLMMSCGEDSPLNVCASCTEQTTGTVAADYCANTISVDAYITTLENTAGQDWVCTKR